VLADNPVTACVIAVTLALQDYRRSGQSGEFSLGRIFHTAELGQADEEQVLVGTKLVLETAELPFTERRDA